MQPLHQYQQQAALQQYAEQQYAEQQAAQQAAQQAEQQQAAQQAEQQQAEQQAAALLLQAQQAEQQAAALLLQAQQAAQQAEQQQAEQQAAALLLQAQQAAALLHAPPPPQAPAQLAAQPPAPGAQPPPAQLPAQLAAQPPGAQPPPQGPPAQLPIQPPPIRSQDDPALSTHTYDPNPLTVFIDNLLRPGFYHTKVPGKSTDRNALPETKVRDLKIETEHFGIIGVGAYKGVRRMVLTAYEFKTVDPNEHIIEFSRDTSSSRRYKLRNYGDPHNPTLSFYLAAIKQQHPDRMKKATDLRNLIAPLANTIAAALGRNPNFYTEAANTEVFIAYAQQVGELCVFNAVSKCAIMYRKGSYTENTGLYPEEKTLVIYDDGGNCFQSLELMTERWEDIVDSSCGKVIQNHYSFYNIKEPFNNVTREVYPATSLVDNNITGSKFVVIRTKTEVYSLGPYFDFDGRDNQYGLSFYTALAGENALDNAIRYKQVLAQESNAIATSLGRKIDFGARNRGADTEVFFAYVELTKFSLCVYNDATKVAIMYKHVNPINPEQTPIYLYNDGKNKFQRLTKLVFPPDQQELKLPPVVPEGTLGLILHRGRQWFGD